MAEVSQMQLDTDGLKNYESRYVNRTKEHTLQDFRKEDRAYSLAYLRTGFTNLIVIILAFVAGAHPHSGPWLLLLFISGFILIFSYIGLGARAKYLAYLLAIYHKKS